VPPLRRQGRCESVPARTSRCEAGSALSSFASSLPSALISFSWVFSACVSSLSSCSCRRDLPITTSASGIRLAAAQEPSGAPLVVYARWVARCEVSGAGA